MKALLTALLLMLCLSPFSLAHRPPPPAPPVDVIKECAKKKNRPAFCDDLWGRKSCEKKTGVKGSYWTGSRCAYEEYSCACDVDEHGLDIPGTCRVCRYNP
jgi:hypothetical protein